MRIAYTVHRFTLQAEEPIELPPYKGSTLRGGFGTAFRRVVCALKKTDCGDCLLKGRCVYAYVFESQPEEEVHVFGRVRSIPRPFVLEPPEDKRTVYDIGETLQFNLILVGRATDYLPYFVYAFEELGRTGIGRGRGRFRLEDVSVQTSGPPRSVYRPEEGRLLHTHPSILDLTDAIMEVISPTGVEPSASLTLRFETPTRLKYQRRLTIEPHFHVLIRQLLRRLFLLWYFHCGGRDEAEPFRRDYHRLIIEKAKEVQLTRADLRWYDWQRYSHRQGTMMRLGGFVGEATYTGPVSQFIPFLRAGQILHLGKGTTFGLGRFTLLT